MDGTAVDGGASFSRSRKINRACMCKRHFRRPRDSRSKSARSGSRRRNEQPGQILQRGESIPLFSSLSFLRNKNKTRENTPCEKIFLISFSSNASEQNYRIEGSTESSFIVIRDNKSMNYGFEL